MKWWIKFGCFLTGYNYRILASCSEVSQKRLKRYAAAMVIICIIWSFIGFVFADRYLKCGVLGSLIGGIILCLIIIQIERQIILSSYVSGGMATFRTIIAFTMALIGSIIVDQKIFEEDIELGKIETLNNKVNKILPDRQREQKNQIDQLDRSILNKERERSRLSADIALHPTIKSYSSQSNSTPVVTTNRDSINGTKQNVKIVKTNSVSVSSIPNPNIALLKPLDEQLAELREVKLIKEASLIKLRSEVENDIKGKTGFLDELNVMAKLLWSSPVALLIWFLWLLFLTCIELFILFSKRSEEKTSEENDYDLTIKHHMMLQKRKLQLMANHLIEGS
ncbi:DUF4407 domain-containing protein [Mucilaginibacter roseus]|uniref:DUF4407 domain-containing protein n=1 Tax=Mucilaginibacter roseus TaxID=1528868 RepID=A0ABS8TZ88_9SPHI|nr:DUF4407 domain-containing protein [Mucilaginibacter roseus]MCD8740181.1 DUF4407 domain-containing protein [Mucilaginibacter roseus]